MASTLTTATAGHLAAAGVRQPAASSAPGGTLRAQSTRPQLRQSATFRSTPLALPLIRIRRTARSTRRGRTPGAAVAELELPSLLPETAADALGRYRKVMTGLYAAGRGLANIAIARHVIGHCLTKTSRVQIALDHAAENGYQALSYGGLLHMTDLFGAGPVSSAVGVSSFWELNHLLQAVTVGWAVLGPVAAVGLGTGRGLHSFPFPLNLSLPCPFTLSLSSLCPLHNAN
jgi:hypothetical protein